MTTITQLSGYIMQDWLDRILKVDPDGKPILKRDENGIPILNQYTGYPEFEAFEEGTRFYASRMLHMEQGIYNAHFGLDFLDKEIKKIRAQLELDGRVPNNAGTFVDAFDGTTSRLTRLTTKTDVTDAVAAGSTVVIPVASVVGFNVMTYATIYDADSYEQVLIIAVGENTITVQALTSDYAKGAKIARSTASVDTINQTLNIAPFVIYSIELVEVV